MLFRGINEITSVGLLTELYLFTELKSRSQWRKQVSYVLGFHSYAALVMCLVLFLTCLEIPPNL